MMIECPDCGMKPLPCPFCGKDAKIFGSNMVGCTDQMNCCAGNDFGHWCGVLEDGTHAVHWVIKAWNKRVNHNENA